ncbi:SDR family NAD(P)-dependent oxidoreductase [Rhodococcus sp. NPDC127530]|uniref:SDR family NAD(P)-dependent oxidoreductase n=1 Tax=unclassified Rhodococcus (in: high G+C Gram-positive bacteria) TaxID=192944 RepID=UPI0036321AAB
MIETASGTGARLADRTAVITGGASGIGRASALRCSAEGAEVVVWDRITGANLEGMFLVTRALRPSMIPAGGGAIVNTASVAAFIACGGWHRVYQLEARCRRVHPADVVPLRTPECAG